MTIPADAIKTLDGILSGLEVGSPIELADVVAIRALIRDALPDFQVEAYHYRERIFVGVGLSGIVLVKRELVAV